MVTSILLPIDAANVLEVVEALAVVPRNFFALVKRNCTRNAINQAKLGISVSVFTILFLHNTVYISYNIFYIGNC